MIERITLEDLDSEQRRALPSSIPPESIRLERCTDCGYIATYLPGVPLDPWKKHFDYCGEPEEDDD